MAWLRLYDDLLDDPKIQMLSDRAFRMLINLWCLAKRNDGVISGDMNSMVFSLRWPRGKILDTLQALISAGLIEKVETGYEPHNWKKRQFQSDSSSERVERCRERQRNAKRNGDETLHATPPETEQRQSRAEQSARGAPRSRDSPISNAEMQARMLAKIAADEGAGK